MKSFKNWFTAGVFALAFIAAMMIHSANPSRTVDFRGEVMTVITSESGITTVYAESTSGGYYLFRIDESTKLQNCCGEEITADSIAEGATVDVDYRKHFFKEEDVYTAKKLTLYVK